MEERERLEALRGELRAAIASASRLLDDRVYTDESYFSLVQAIGCAKVALADASSDVDALEVACTSLHKAADAMIPRAKAQKTAKQEKKRTVAPALIVGAFCGGVLLGKHLSKKRKRK